MTSNPPAAPTLLTIPTELRLMIFEFTFSNTIVDISRCYRTNANSGRIEHSERIENTVVGCNAGLLLTCKVLNKEATKPYFRHSIFHARDSEDITAWLDNLRAHNKISNAHFVREIQCGGLMLYRSFIWGLYYIPGDFIILDHCWISQMTTKRLCVAIHKGKIQFEWDKPDFSFQDYGIHDGVLRGATVEETGREEKWELAGQRSLVELRVGRGTWIHGR